MSRREFINHVAFWMLLGLWSTTKRIVSWIFDGMPGLDVPAVVFSIVVLGAWAAAAVRVMHEMERSP